MATYEEDYDHDLNPILEKSSNDELSTIVEYINKKATGMLEINDTYKKYYPNHQKYVYLIADHVRRMGGNTFVNLFRVGGPSYHEIVCDVASKLKAKYNKKDDIEDIEQAILEKILEQAINKMSDHEKQELMKTLGKAKIITGSNMSRGLMTACRFAFKAGGFQSYQLSVIIANQIARAVLGRGLSLATNAGITKVLSIAVGPVGWVITGIWTAIDIAGPAYSVTIPTVVHIAMLRLESKK